VLHAFSSCPDTGLLFMPFSHSILSLALGRDDRGKISVDRDALHAAPTVHNHDRRAIAMTVEPLSGLGLFISARSFFHRESLERSLLVDKCSRMKRRIAPRGAQPHGSW